MFDKLNHITLSGEVFPIRCGMDVLEQIQEKYGDISEFEEKLLKFVPDKDEKGEPKKNKEGLYIGTYAIPDIKALNDSLYWMVKCGLEIEVEENGNPVQEVSRKRLLRLVDMPPVDLGKVLHEEFSRCFKRKNE